MKSSKTLRKPSNWQDFESLCKKLWGEVWNCKEIKKNGKPGQKQNGVDIYGIPEGEKEYFGIQCKRTEKLTENVIETEIENAKNFQPLLKRLYIATTTNKDVNIEEFVRYKNIENREDSFGIEIFSWEDIVDLIDENKKTHDWYVNSQNYYSKKAVKVTFENDLEEIYCSPIFEKHTTLYKHKTVPSSILGSYNNLDWLNKNHYHLMETKTNHSFSFFKLKIKNTGEHPIEDYVLNLKLEGDVSKITNTNQEGGINFNIPSYQMYQMSFNNENFTVKIRPNPNKKTLISNDYFILPKIYFLPKYNKNCTISLKWELLSRDFSEHGRLKINIYPKIIKTEEAEYVEDPSKVGKKEKLRQYITRK